VFVGRTVAFIVVAAAAGLVGGCQNVGPTAISLGRDRYNAIIQSTSKEQTLSNIIRVFHHEPTSFMDVSEVDATTSFSTNVNGTVSNIGAMATHSTTAGTLSGQVGAVGGNATYSESPLIRYTPLLGQSLVAQLATPVSPDALSSLYNSNWDVMPLLDFSTSYLTPDFGDFYAALNTIAALYNDEVVSLVSTKSDLTQKGDASGGGATKGAPKSPNPPGTLTLEVANKPSSGGDDALTLYLNPFHARGARDAASGERRDLQLWARLLWLYAGTQKSFTPPSGAKCAEFGLSSYSESELRRLDVALGSGRYGLATVRQCLPSTIELRTAPVSAVKLRDEHLATPAPMLRTLSALGILKNSTELPHPKIGFVTPEQYSRIVDYPWNKGDKSLSFYTLLSETEGPEDDPKKDPRIDENVTRWLMANPDGRFLYEPRSPMAGLDEFMRGNRRLGHLRRYILIIVSPLSPAGAYVAHYDRGLWYYIDAADEVSQKNFDLIALFLTMMAVPSATTPISPTISVGGAP
jgi:hypothetical protein